MTLFNPPQIKRKKKYTHSKLTRTICFLISDFEQNFVSIHFILQTYELFLMINVAAPNSSIIFPEENMPPPLEQYVEVT